MPRIAATATIDKTARIADDVVIGPGCVIEPDVTIGSGCVLKANVMICSGTTLGRNNRVFANVVLGEEPQYIGLVAPQSQLVIGDDNTFRENVTISRGAPVGGGKTTVGNRNYLMVGAHLGHDVTVEDEAMIGNNALISGHCKIETRAWVSAATTAHQFATIGRFAYTAGLTTAHADLPPFMKVSGLYPSTVRGVNVTGLSRAGIPADSIANLEKAYRRLYRRKDGRSIRTIIDDVAAEFAQDPNVTYLCDSLKRSFQHPQGRYLEQFRH